jgi:tetratricopeptide (TPR) repeat protein
VKHAGSAENFYGYVLHLMGNNQEALSHFAHAIEQGRPDGWPERNMAEALSALGKYDEASHYYEKAIVKVEDLIAKGAGTSRGQEILRQLGEEIGGFYNAYAWHLVTKPHASQSDGKKAVELALVASKHTDERKASFLDTLAHAFALTGDVCRAAEVEERAFNVETSASNDTAEFLKHKEEWRAACAQTGSQTTRP